MRNIIELSQNWLFSKTCTEVPVNMPAGGDWEPVTIPHCWNAVDGHDGTPYDRGAYWYVTTFTAPTQPIPGGRTYIEVGAAGLVGEIWVNGRQLARHVGGYSAFRADATDACHPGENVLAILCDNRYSDKVYPQRADFVFFGGLYRHVRIISVAASRFTLDDHGGEGVYIDAEPCGGGAAVKVRALLDGLGEKQTVSLQITDAAGVQVAEAWNEAASETLLCTFIPEAKLWDGTRNSALYTAKLSLVSFNEVLDQVTVRFGIRSFAVDKEQGFFLNGESHPLRGVCRHQDRLYQGNALSREQHYEDARIIADMGANCIRLAHYQQSHDIYDACDELGLVVWAEIPYFATSWDDDAHAAAVNEIKEMVIQNYNHPSIFFWGLSNEILMGSDHPKLLGCHEDLRDAVKSIDTKRLTVVAHEFTTPWEHDIHAISDAEGWNHYFGWYRGDMGDLAGWCDDYHAAYPDRRISISEYGCDAVLTYHSDEPVKMDYTEEYQVLIHENACETWASRPWIWGTFVWNMFDFGSNFRREGGTKGRNNKGLVTLDRKIKKDSYYVYKAWYSDEPFVHIDGRRYYARPGKTTTVRIHSNLSAVELFADGVSLGTVKGEHTFIFENVPLKPEGTVLTARAGDCTDTITLRSVEEKPEVFTFPGFRQTMDAVNWFESVEEVVGTLEPVPGFYSIHDPIGEVCKNAAAKAAVLNTLIAVTGRPMDDGILLSGDPNASVADTFGSGFLYSMLGDKRETAMRRMHSALVKVEKA